MHLSSNYHDLSIDLLEVVQLSLGLLVFLILILAEEGDYD